MGEPAQQGCHCPADYPREWLGKDMDFAGWCVHRMGIAAFAHMPLSYETYLAKQQQNIDDLDLQEKWPGLVLTRTGWFGGEILRFIEDAETASRLVQYLPAPFQVNVALHEGGMGTVTKSVAAQQMRIIDSGNKPKELYLAHLTCPVCEAEKGGEKIMLIRRWQPSKHLAARMKKAQSA